MWCDLIVFANICAFERPVSDGDGWQASGEAYVNGRAAMSVAVRMKIGYELELL